VTVMCSSTTRTEHVAFVVQQWLHECAMINVIHLSCLGHHSYVCH